MVSLGGGNPNPQLFPFDNFTVQLKDGSSLTPNPAALAEALQYSPSEGLPSLRNHLQALIEREHDPIGPRDRSKLAVTTGSQEALSIMMNTVLDEDRVVLVEDPCYTGALSILNQIGCRIGGVAVDAQGLIPDALEAKIEALKEDSRHPLVLYSVPTAQNPSGCTMTSERRRTIYEICSKFNVLILEDDPYWFLSSERRPGFSFFSMDVDGRVVRFDSFSKILSGGMRLGWVTGPAPLVNCMLLHVQSSNLHTSGISQLVVSELFDVWGYEKFNRHAEQASKFYLERRDNALRLADKHLTGLAQWNLPGSGSMFLWLKLLGIEDSKELVEDKARSAKVLMVPGQAFSPNGQKTPYVRISFSTASDSDLEAGFSRLASILKDSESSV
jgi:kynurenine/2-aminoadipate aminotransferase